MYVCIYIYIHHHYISSIFTPDVYVTSMFKFIVLCVLHLILFFLLPGNAQMVRLCAPCSAFFEAQTASVVCTSYLLGEILSFLRLELERLIPCKEKHKVRCR